MVLRILIVAVLTLLAILVGGITAAWRRACVQMTRRAFPFVNRELVLMMTPPSMAWRHVWAIRLWILTGLVALLLFGWKIALGSVVVTYAAMELAGFAFPRPNSMYYVHASIRDLEFWIRVYTRRGEADKAAHAQRHLNVLRSAYELDPEKSEASTAA